MWAWGALSIDDLTTYECGTSIHSFMSWAVGQKKLWFHNLKFDAAFICFWLLNNGFEHATQKLEYNQFKTIVSKGGKWFSLAIKTSRGVVKIGDSLKKLPFSVRQIAKAWKLDTPKGEIDYLKPRPEGYIPDDTEWKYLHTDCKIVAEALRTLLLQGNKKLTIGSDALEFYKEIMGKYYRHYFPVLDDEIDAFIRKSYRGGFTYNNMRGEFRDTLVLDVNSLYPAAMKMPLPIGEPIKFWGEHKETAKYPLYIIRFTADFHLRDGFIPTIQLKGGQYAGWHKPTDYVTDSKGPQELTLTSVDFELFKKHYHINEIVYHDGYMFQSRTGLFDSYIDYFMQIKETSTGPIREWAKLMLNNLYGKLATNPDRTRKYPVLEDGKLRMLTGEQETGTTEYIPAGSFITANARYVTITAAQENRDRLIYCDTDSLHLTGWTVPEGIEVHDTKLGAWKVEERGTRSRYIRAKTYCILVRTETKRGGHHYELIFKCAGMPEACKKHATWNNFKPGQEFEGKLVPKYVPGGVYLKPIKFTMEVA